MERWLIIFSAERWQSELSAYDGETLIAALWPLAGFDFFSPFARGKSKSSFEEQVK
jgi:hypothetical protein